MVISCMGILKKPIVFLYRAQIQYYFFSICRITVCFAPAPTYNWKKLSCSNLLSHTYLGKQQTKYYRALDVLQGKPSSTRDSASNDEMQCQSPEC